MHPRDFSKNKPGQFSKLSSGHVAFVPDPLPPNIRITWGLAERLNNATRALATLAGISQHLINPNLLIRPFVRREAVLSSAIEGTQTSLSDLFLQEAQTEVPLPAELRPPDDLQEVRNYVSALDYGIERLNTLPPSLRLLRELHEKLLRGVRGGKSMPGRFRTTQVHIGGSNDIGDATYIPPPPLEMKVALDAFERWLHEPSQYPALIRLAMAHYQFEAIHPFLDGNGRVGRLLITILIAHEKLLPEPLLYLSAYFERNRREYYSHLLAVSQRGHWNQWIEFFLQGVTEQANDAIARSQRLADLRAAYRDIITTARTSSLTLRLVEHLFQQPCLTIGDAARILGVGYTTAKNTVERLVSERILVEMTGRQRDRIFAAQSVIDTVEKPLDEPSPVRRKAPSRPRTSK